MSDHFTDEKLAVNSFRSIADAYDSLRCHEALRYLIASTRRAPRGSVLAEMVTLQALSVALQAEKNWDSISYVRCHPGGALGKLRKEEIEVQC